MNRNNAPTTSDNNNNNNNNNKEKLLFLPLPGTTTATTRSRKEIPKFVKPGRPVRNVSNLTCDVVGTPSSLNNSFKRNSEFNNNPLTRSGSSLSPSHCPSSTSEVVLTEGALTISNITFGAQENLPHLPIPSLEETMSKFLKNLEPLQDCPAERSRTKQLVNGFLKEQKDDDIDEGKESSTTTTGPQLQRLLLEYDRIGRENGTIGSYVEEFWNESYLAPNESVVLNLNPYFVLESPPDPKIIGNQIRRAASLCFASIKMASQLRSHNLKGDHIHGKPLCMDQFLSLFGASRIPQRSKDTISVYEKTNHVAVMCCNQLFYFQALWPDGDVAADEGDLVDIIEAISFHAHKIHDHGRSSSSKDNTTGDDEKLGGSSSTSVSVSKECDDDQCRQKDYTDSLSALGVLTSLGRNQWAKAREEIISFSPTKNAESFKIIDSALFVLVLDDYIPKNKHEAAANMLHGSYELSKRSSIETGSYNNEYQSGSCTNRWYDKLQIIVTADGGAGINFEHSAIDGHTALRFVSDIYAETVISFAKSITKLVHAHDGLIPSVITATVRRAAVTLDSQGRTTLDVFPKKINFDLSDCIKRKIYFAETGLGDHIVASDTHILEFTDYGKRFITYNKLSPDSYVQMSMMLAYYRLYGETVCAYEPVLTKAFYHGRTEAMRPATMEAKELCEIFCNPDSTSEEKVIALQNATRVHSKLVKECAQGQGCDRHLFSLKCIAEKNDLPIPDFFRSEPWRLLNHTILSTSNCGNPSLGHFGFGPVVADGYGIGYIIKDFRLHYAICSKHRQTTRYALALEGVLREMASILEPISSTKVHDNRHRPQRRSSLKKISSRDISYNSYGDVWRESSLKLVNNDDNGGRKLQVFDEKPESRWSARKIDVTSTDNSDSDPDLPTPVFQIKMNDVDDDNVNSNGNRSRLATTKREQSQKRIGSDDFMPIRPDRRASQSTILFPGQLHEIMQYDELSKLCDAIDFDDGDDDDS